MIVVLSVLVVGFAGYVATVLSGVAVGRLVFTAADPAAMVRRLAAVVHDRTLAVVR